MKPPYLKKNTPQGTRKKSARTSYTQSRRENEKSLRARKSEASVTHQRTIQRKTYKVRSRGDVKTPCLIAAKNILLNSSLATRWEVPCGENHLARSTSKILIIIYENKNTGRVNQKILLHEILNFEHLNVVQPILEVFYF